MTRLRFGVAMLAIAQAATAFAGQSPLTLRQAVDEALRASPALRRPGDDRTVAEIRHQQSAAEFGVKLTPTFQTGTDPAGLNARSMGVSLSKRLRTGTAFAFNATRFEFGTASSHVRDSGYTVGISQPLLRGWTGVASARVDQAKRQTASAERRLADASQALMITVADAYYTVVRAQRLVESAERALDRARQLRRSSEARSTVGLATELDVLRADLLAAQSEAALASQQEALDTAFDALKTLIGRPVHSDVAVAAGDVAGGDEAPAESIERLTAIALAHRVDVRDARERIIDARRIASVARWDLLPPVNLEASYTKRGLGAARPYAFQPLFDGWHVGLSTSYGFNRSDAQAGAAIADVSVRAAEREAEDTERRVADDVRRAHRAWVRSLGTLGIQSKAVLLAERQLRLAHIRYERGVAGNFDVIDAENNLNQAHSALIGAQVERALAGLALKRSTGTLTVEAFLP